jgi:hypothetical protein
MLIKNAKPYWLKFSIIVAIVLKFLKKNKFNLLADPLPKLKPNMCNHHWV